MAASVYQIQLEVPSLIRQVQLYLTDLLDTPNQCPVHQICKVEEIPNDDSIRPGKKLLIINESSQTAESVLTLLRCA